MSWPDWFAVSIFKSVNWEMSKGQKVNGSSEERKGTESSGNVEENA